ncbi:CinA family protein [Neisseria sp. Ec49-e6-T10]|uniref:CinA family protein n=1 Tax=Neisseria sp. Ec49-e6-T10 TaxID=3140744 RepID=UPI003EBF37AE
MNLSLPSLFQLLRTSSLKITCAESCTGGLLAGKLTEVSGSSQWFEMGFVTYSNQAKHLLLSVQENTLLQYGAVSEETAKEMALGAKQKASADIALSITGIAGPTGATKTKPVGTVCFGISCATFTQTYTCHFNGNRNMVREQAVAFALNLLLETLKTLH